MRDGRRALRLALWSLTLVVMSAGVVSAGGTTPVRVNSNPPIPVTQNNPDVSGDVVVYVRAGLWDRNIYGKNLETGEEFPVCTAAGDQDKPVIDGDRVVWEDKRNGNWDLYTKDLSSGVESVVCTETGDQTRADVDGDRVVWEDRRFAGETPDHWSDIYMKDLATGDETIVAQEHTGETHPTISGDHVAWVRWSEWYEDGRRKVNGAVQWKNLVTGQVLGLGQAYTDMPDLDDGIMVFYYLDFNEDDEVSGRYVAAFNINSAEVQVLATEVSSSCEPRISDGMVAWYDYKSATGTHNILAKPAFSGIPPAIVASRSTWVGGHEIDGPRVVWGDARLSWDVDVYERSLPVGEETLVSTNDAFPSQQTQPVIGGERVVWSDGRTKEVTDDYLYTKNLANGEEQGLTFGDFPLIYDLSGDRLVWWSYKSGKSDIKMRNLATGADTDVCTDPAWQYYPAISGDLVVWTDTRNTTDTATDEDVYMRDLGIGVESKVATGTGLQRMPDVAGHVVVWEDTRDGDCDIYLKDLDAGEEAAVATGTAQQLDPAVSDRFVVWEDRRSDPDGDVYFMDLAGGEATHVVDAAGAQKDPDVSGDLCVWIDERDGYATLRARRLPDGEEMVLVAEEQARPESPSVCGDRVVWKDSRDATAEYPDDNIYMMTVDSGGSDDSTGPVTAVAVPAWSSSERADGRFTAAWSATDPAPSSGVVSYDVERKSGKTGTFASLMPETCQLSTLCYGSPGYTYYFRARARDGAGNLGGWSPERAVVSPYDHNKARYSRYWSTARASSLYRGSAKYATRKGAYATYRFSGARSLGLVITRRRNGGYGRVYINGRYAATVNFYSSSTRVRHPVTIRRWSKPTSGTVKLVATGTKPRGSKGTRIELDGIAVGK